MPHCPSWLNTIFKLILAGFFASILVVCATILYLAPQLPDVEQIRDVRLQVPLKVFSADGKLIGEFGEQKRTPIQYHQIPEDYLFALLATEDDNFFNHHGVDLFGILRAVSQIITDGGSGSGGSTITMQVARHFFLTLDRTYIRKANEILLALQIENELTKEQILELYANYMFLGKRAHGIQAAANVYYGKNIDELSLAQVAMLVGVYKWPSTRNPINDPESALARRDFILGRMLLLNYIDEERYQTALAQPLTAKIHGSTVEVNSPYVAEMVRSEMYKRYGSDAYLDGYEVLTTIDSSTQSAAERALISGVKNYDQRHGYRGPEASVDSAIFEDNESLVSYLSEVPSIASLVPAIVTEVDEKSAIIFIRDQGYLELGWEQGISGARPFMTHSWVGDAPETASNVLQPGDLIRVEADSDGQWRLTQLPNAQAALVALDPLNGAIRALSGGFDFYYNRFNRVTSAKRQPGSALKPFLYATAIGEDFTPASLVNDAPIVVEDAVLEDIWRPINDSGKFYGPTRLREALYYSRNLVSIRILRALGISKARDEILRFGFEREDLATNLTLALGSQALEPVKLARAYAAFANGGYLVEPHFIQEIRDRDGDSIYLANPPRVCRDCDEKTEEITNLGEFSADIHSTGQLDPEGLAALAEILGAEAIEDTSIPEPIPAEQIMDPRVHFIMHSMLQDVVQRGTGTKAKELERSDIAGKTGTTNGPRDAWFSGYSPHLVATTWLGFDDNSLLGNSEFGGTAALPIWIDFMREALADLPEYQFRQPDGLVIARINSETGERTSPKDPQAIFEYFLRENTPELTAEITGENLPDTTIETDDIF